MPHSNRVALFKEIEASRNSKVLLYVTGDRKGMETQISEEVGDFFVHHLDIIGVVPKISLILYTRGGNTLSAWSLANLLLSFCDELEIIVPNRCHSGGTLLCLGASKIVMTKQATLGPIDPSVNTPLNPLIPGGNPTARVPISVEDVQAFVDHATQSLGDNGNLQSVFEKLSESVHPLVLGTAFRARSQIRMLGEKLLAQHMTDMDTVGNILDFLCSDSGSHDYTINRREAKNSLNLPIEKPSEELYRIIKQIYDDFADELKLATPFDPGLELAGQKSVDYTHVRGLVESVGGGCHSFISEGTLSIQSVGSQQGIHDQRRFEGWRHDNA